MLEKSALNITYIILEDRKLTRAKTWTLETLLDIIDRLRSPDGCLWDRNQTKQSVSRYLIEEAYEVVEAIKGGYPEDLKEELGDLLFQILFLVKISEESGEFDISAVIKDISEKMVRRHPHVFGTTEVNTVEEIKSNWEDIKRREEGKTTKGSPLFHGISNSLPALSLARKITEKASCVGFDWNDVNGVLHKIDEEKNELKAAIQENKKEQITDEMGDLLFSLVNLSRFLEVDPENALRSTITKFKERFSFIETKLKEQGKDIYSSSLEEMDDLWERSKNKKE